jgi:hypothetical protein
MRPQGDPVVGRACTALWGNTSPEGPSCFAGPGTLSAGAQQLGQTGVLPRFPPSRGPPPSAPCWFRDPLPFPYLFILRARARLTPRETGGRFSPWSLS